MNFDSKAEKISWEIFIKKSFIVKKRKVTKPQIDENILFVCWELYKPPIWQILLWEYKERSALLNDNVTEKMEEHNSI